MSIKQLKKFARSVNIASELEQEQLDKIGRQVLEGFTEDLNSNQEWLADIKKVEELASLKSGKKSTPLPNSANVKLPLIAKACYEFSSKVSPELIRDGKVANSRVVGKDQKNQFKLLMAKRTSDYINYQLLIKTTEWETQLNNLLFRVALIGFICTKTYFDPIRKKLKCLLCKPDELIIHCDSPSLEEAPRISHILHWRLNDFIEQMNTESNGVSVLSEEPVKELVNLHKTDTLNKCIDVIEQCTYLDLDEDGYAEPYVVTVIKETGKVARIVTQFEEEDIHGKNDEVAYIDRAELYEDYHFLTNPKGNFQSVGFGILLLHLNEAANSTTNQLMDAAQLANMKGGYMDARLQTLVGGNSLHDPGEFKLTKVNSGLTLKDGILPIEYSEPSSVMFQLLNLIISVSRDLTSSAEINTGTQSSENAKTGATLALQQEGRKIFNAINKGIYRSLSKHLLHIFKINGKYLDQDEYMNVLDDPMANVKKDFDTKLVSVVPTADPTLVSDTQRLTEATVIQSLLALPGIDPIKATKLILERVSIPGIQDIMMDENQPAPPNPEVLKLQAEMEKSAQELNIEGHKLEQADKRLLIDAHLAEAQIEQMKANAIALMAKAGSEEQKTQLQTFTAQLDAISRKIDADMGLAQMQHEKETQALDQAHQMQMAQQPSAPPEASPTAEVTPNDTTQGPSNVA